MPGRGPAVAGEPVQNKALVIFFTTRAFIKFLNHHFARISLRLTYIKENEDVLNDHYL